MITLKSALAACLFFCMSAAQAIDLVIDIDEAQQIRFTAEQLLTIAPAELKTATPWDGDEPPATYQGVYLADLFNLLEHTPEQIRAIALNHYAMDIPFQRAIDANAFIAVHENGRPMPIRDRGPYWLIFPFFADDQTLPIKDLTPWAVWQLNTLQVID